MSKKNQKQVDPQEKLKKIEDEWYNIGLVCTKSFDEYTDIVSIRGGVMAHRCSMQAMRDQMRYSIKK